MVLFLRDAMNNTEHLPGISDSTTAGNLAAEQFRAGAGRQPRPLTPEQQEARERYLRWHRTGSLG